MACRILRQLLSFLLGIGVSYIVLLSYIMISRAGEDAISRNGRWLLGAGIGCCVCLMSGVLYSFRCRGGEVSKVEVRDRLIAFIVCLVGFLVGFFL